MKMGTVYEIIYDLDASKSAIQQDPNRILLLVTDPTRVYQKDPETVKA